MIGQVLKGIYRLYDRVGSGGFATVYLGRNLETNEVVAVKILKQDYIGERKFVERFRREAEMAYRLKHPNIVRMIDYGVEGNVHFLVMEYVEGKTLAQIIQERGPMPVDDVVAIGAQVCRALDAAARAGVVHRDIKPHNVMVTPGGAVKVMDFGIARIANTSSLTQTGMFMGTPHYLSPEMVRGSEVDVRSDLYALGIVLFEALTGNVPFRADSPWAVLHQQTEAPPPLLRSVRPDAPAWLEKIISRALEKKPEDRFRNPADMLAALAGHGVPIEAPEIGNLVLTPRPKTMAGRRAPAGPARPKWMWPAVAGGFLGLAVLGLILVPLLTHGEPTPTPTTAVAIAVTSTLIPTYTPAPSATHTPSAVPSATHTDTPAPTATLQVLVVTATPTSTPPATPTPVPSVTSEPSATSPQPTRTQAAATRPPAPQTPTEAPTAAPPPSAPAGAGSGRIAFAAIQGGKYVLYSANPDGSDLRWLGDNLRQPSYRQDGKLIVANGVGGQSSDLCKVKPDGGGISECFGQPEDEHPVWIQSSSGYYVAFGSPRHGDKQWRLFLQDNAIGYGSGEVRGRYTAWLPPESVAYQGCDYGFGTSSRCGLFRVSVWGGIPSQLTDQPNDVPTGGGDAGVLFTREADGNWDVYLVSPTGGAARRLTDHAGNDGGAAWSPNGQSVAFLSNRSGAWAIWLMNRDGSNQRKAFDLPGAGYGADWALERISWGPLPAAPTPGPTPIGGDLLPAPQITFPIPRDTVGSNRETVVKWTWSGTLSANQGFQLRFWHRTDPAPMGITAPTSANEAVVNFGLTDSWRMHGDNTNYYLDVVVVQIEPHKVLSRSSAIEVVVIPDKR